jgi:D-alanyl-D-alanine carboxypeptidase (penicillin-binding protein 5/6)
MRRRMQGALATLVAAGTALLGPAAPPAAAATGEIPPPRADIVVDAGTGRVLICDRVHEPLHPASTAKIVTALTALERMPPDTVVEAHPDTATVPANKIGFPAGTKWPLEQMLAALMMTSANDAAYAIAHTAGGLEKFETMMNDTARRLGMRDSTFNDPSGLDDAQSYKGGPYSTAYDLAIAARNALAVPEIARWAARREYSFTDPSGTGHDLTNHNRMLPGGAYQYDGATGFKTGFTSQAQHTIVATATRAGRTLIAVVLGAVTPGGYAEASSLLDAGFASNGTGPDGTPACNGETLPANNFSPFTSRLESRDAFAELGGTPAGAAPGDAAASVPTAPDLDLDQPPRAAAPAAPTVVRADDPSGPLTLRNTSIVVVVLGAVTVALRRRAVKRRRARRLEQRRRRMAAIRSGGLPVVDGRYRPGLRMGPPLESHVRVRRASDRTAAIDAELDALDA